MNQFDYVFIILFLFSISLGRLVYVVIVLQYESTTCSIKLEKQTRWDT